MPEPTVDITIWVAISALALAIVGVVIRVGMWIGSVNTELNSFKGFMEKIEGKLDDLTERINGIGTDIVGIKMQIRPAPLAGQSPVHLTEYGQSVSDELQIRQWAEEQAGKLYDLSRGKEEFEIYDLCKEHVDELLTTSGDFNVYVRSGAYDLGREIDVVTSVCAVELRDAILRLQSEDE